MFLTLFQHWRRINISYNTVGGPPSETLIVLLGQFTGCLRSGSLRRLDDPTGDGGHTLITGIAHLSYGGQPTEFSYGGQPTEWSYFVLFYK